MSQHPWSLSVVLPAYNEAANLPLSVAATASALHGLVRDWEILIVDDGSVDATREVAAQLAAADSRVKVLRHGQNRGYGAALRTGFRNASKELVFFTDADNQFDVTELGGLLPLVSRYDIVAGYRAVRQDPWNRQLNARGWGQLVNALFELDIRDVNCAFKLFRRRVLDRVEIRSDGAFVNTEVLARARAAGCTIREVPVRHFPRTVGEQTGARPRVILRAFAELVRLYGELRTASAPEPAPSAEALPRLS